jgi:acyl-CoA thioester hydrolase
MTSLTPTKPPAREGAVRIRVRYAECDPMGVAHHGSYIPWLEVGRTELLRDSGVSYADMERSGVYLVISRLECSYRRPVFYDDVVEVRTKVRGGSRVKIEHEYEVVLVEDGGHGAHRTPRPAGEVVTTARSTLVCVGREGKVIGLPAWLVGENAVTSVVHRG